MSICFLLGERDYGPPIDLWGGGCIMAEMWTRSPIMQGNTEQHQLTLISQLCGSITPEVTHIELYFKPLYTWFLHLLWVVRLPFRSNIACSNVSEVPTSDLILSKQYKEELKM